LTEAEKEKLKKEAGEKEMKKREVSHGDMSIEVLNVAINSNIFC